MARNNKRFYLRYAIKNKIYRADARDLGLDNTIKPHDVIVISVNKRSNKCKVKTITSLEKTIVKNGVSKQVFINNKLDDVRDGKIIVIPQKDINTHHLSGVNNKLLTIKTNKMYFTGSGVKFPRRYKHIINKK